MAFNLDNSLILTIGFIIAALRLYFEIMTHYVEQENKIGHFWQSVLKTSARIWGAERSERLHFFGLMMSIGHLVLFLPQVLWQS